MNDALRIPIEITPIRPALWLRDAMAAPPAPWHYAGVEIYDEPPNDDAISLLPRVRPDVPHV